MQKKHKERKQKPKKIGRQIKGGCSRNFIDIKMNIW